MNGMPATFATLSPLRTEGDVHLQALAVAVVLHLHGLAALVLCEDADQVATVVHVLARDPDNNVPRLEARLRRWACWVDRADAQNAALDTPGGDELFDYRLGCVDGDGEAQPLGGAPDDLRRDAHYLCRRVYQRPAGVAGVDGSVGLDGAGDHVRVLLDQAVLSADHAPGDGGPAGQVQGVTDGHHFLPHLQPRGVAQHSRRYVFDRDLEDGQVGGLVAAHRGGRKLTPVAQGHRNALCGLIRVQRNHVVVGYDVSL